LINDLFSDVISISVYILSNVGMISEY